MRRPSRVDRLFRRHLAALEPYQPLIPPELLEGEAALPSANVIKLDGNENPYGPSPRVRQALAKLDTCHLYPDPESLNLRRALSSYVSVGIEHLVAGAGSDELIDLVLRLCLEPGEQVINCVPTFGMYSFDTQVCGGEVVNVPRDPATFAVDVARVKAAVGPRTKVIFLASPNNPSGNLTPPWDVLALLELGPLVVLDEAYYEFCGVSLAQQVPHQDNLVVLRTFSKWAGLAGMRVGYGVFPARIVPYMMRTKQPYNVSVAAQVAAEESLKDLAYLREKVEAIKRERERLYQGLGRLAYLRPFPSQANFILCSVLKGKAKALHGKLRQRGIFVRYFDTPLLQDYIRISVGKPEHTDSVLQALREMAP
jgi:histidinol-phosphate aminotransferase